MARELKEKRSDFGFSDKMVFGTTMSRPAKKKRKGKRKKKKN